MTMKSLILLLLPSVTALAADWPQYSGPAGNFAIPADAALSEDAAATRLLWESEVRLGPGKLRSGGNNAPMPSVGVASPIIAGDLVLQAYLWPSGPQPATPPAKPGKSPLDHLVRADDCLVAVDSANGRTRWTFVAKEQGVNNVPDKRGGWGVTPAAADGRVFFLGSGGMLYGISLADGKELWRVAIEPLHGEMMEQSKKMLAVSGAGRRPFKPMPGSLVIAGGVLVVPDFADADTGLLGIDPATGRTIWKLPKAISSTATPTVWRDPEDKPLLLCGTATGTLNLIEPATGKLLWSKSGLGLLTYPLVANRAGLVMLDINPAAKKDLAHMACVAISRSGVEERWRLPDEPRFTSLRGSDGLGYLRTLPWGDDRFLRYGHSGEKDAARFLDVYNARDGRLLASTRDLRPGWDAHYLPVGDRILAQYELGHWKCCLQWFRVDGGKIVPSGSMWDQKDGASGYSVPFMQVPLDGRIVMRYFLGTYTQPGEHGGLRCYDLRATTHTSK